MNAFIHVWLRSVLREKDVTSSALGYCEKHLSHLLVTTTISLVTVHIPSEEVLRSLQLVRMGCLLVSSRHFVRGKYSSIQIGSVMPNETIGVG